MEPIEKKKQPMAVIAFLHFLRGGVFVPFAIFMFVGYPILYSADLAGEADPFSGLSWQSVSVTLSPVLMTIAAYIGGIYSSAHILKTYSPIDANEIVRYSLVIMGTAYLLLVLGTGLKGVGLFADNGLSAIIQLIGMLAAFGIATERRLREAA